jgi:Fe-S cluster assembly protein SufD
MKPHDFYKTEVALALTRSATGPHQPDWLITARGAGAERFSSLGLPTTRDEEWRFTSIAPIVENRFALASNGASGVTPDQLTPFALDGLSTTTLVFVNGRYVPRLSHVGRLPSNVRVESLAAALAGNASPLQPHLTRIADHDQRAFTALNTAFLADGAYVEIPDGTIVETPIHLLFVSARDDRPTMSHPRVLITAGENSQASIIESYGAVGDAQYFTNAVTEIVAGRNAVLHHYKVQREGGESAHIAGIYIRAERDANVSCHSIGLGGALVRNDILATLAGEGITCTLNGLYLGDGRDLVDNHTTIDHATPHCASREVYKGILADHARAVFNGKIIVRQDAQQTDAKQTNKALLLSEDAQINTKPQLEIFANDVKCTHGAAIGQIDDEAIFYLRARGIGKREARHLLIRAFAGDVLNHMPLEPLRRQMERELMARLPEGNA